MVAIFFFAWLGLSTYALWRGGQPERVASGMLLLAYPLSIAMSAFGPRIGGARIGVLMVDIMLLAGLVVLAMRANRYSPMAMAAMQILQVSGHILTLAQPDLPALLYWLTKVFWGYPMLVLLTLATVRHRRRERVNGPEVSWVASSTGQSTTP